jgi:hypothetical protein
MTTQESDALREHLELSYSLLLGQKYLPAILPISFKLLSC